MPKTFMMKLDKIQPTQLFISSEKLSEVMKTFDPKNPKSMEPIPIKKLGKEIIFVDGHTRASQHSYMAFPKFQFIGKMKSLIGKNTKYASNGARKKRFAQ